MAPTEILAQQHYFSARRILENAGYRIVLLTGSLEEDRKREIRRHIAQGNAQLVIGTHALIEEKVEFAKLGLVIVDEQHRFGVMQRFKLMKKTGTKELATATPGRRARATWGRMPSSAQPSEARQSSRARRPGHDRDSDPAHSGAHSLRRSRRQHPRRNAARPHAHRHPPRLRRTRRRSLAIRAQAGRSRTPGLRRLSGDRRERRDRTQSRAQDVQASSARRFFPICASQLLHGRLHPDSEGSTSCGGSRKGEVRDSGLDHGDRSRSGCGQRHRDGDRARRALRSARSCTSCADASAAAPPNRSAF